MHDLGKKPGFLSLVLPAYGKRSRTQIHFPFHLTHQCPKNSDLFFPTMKGSPTACGSLLVFLYITIYVCIYTEFWDNFSGKRSVVEKKDIFHVEKFKGRWGHVGALVFKKNLPAEVSQGLCFQINCMLLSLVSGHGIKTDEPTKQHWAAPESSHHQ